MNAIAIGMFIVFAFAGLTPFQLRKDIDKNKEQITILQQQIEVKTISTLYVPQGEKSEQEPQGETGATGDQGDQVETRTHLAVKSGFDFRGRAKASVIGLSIEENIEPGCTMGFELYHDLYDNFSIGTGFEHQFDRDEFYFSPIIYGLLRFYINSDLGKDERFYLTGKAGYNSFEEYYYDTSGGSYLCFGVGIIRNTKVQLELNYSMHHGSVTDDINGYYLNPYIDYSKFSIIFSEIF